MKIEIAYPFDLYNSLKELPLNNVFPCSALINENIIGGLLLTCSSSDLKFFKVKKSNLPQPDLKFRMINSEQRIFLIEFHLLFDSNKILKLHLNPVHQNVRQFFNLLIEKKIISFHFYNKQTNLIASSYTTLDDEEMEWIIRNNRLINDIKSNKDYLLLDYYMTDKINTNERLFKFNDSKSIEQSFIGINQKVVKLLN
ncbi:MAG: hypothetical protein H6Q18_860 [Bacteroidetes bacterium]|nr:hypothetical protein [Bacteroidota bacterium]